MSELGEMPRKEKKVGTAYIVLTLVTVLIALTAGISFIFFDVSVQVTGPSMQPTFYASGDRVVLLKYAFSVKQGDIVVFRREGAEHPPIKRVIACEEGDVIDIKNGFVYLNGTKLDEPYLAEGMYTYSYDVEMPYTLSADSIFVMGDNRTDSLDSRRYGAVSKSDILGKAIFVYGNGRSRAL